MSIEAGSLYSSGLSGKPYCAHCVRLRSLGCMARRSNSLGTYILFRDERTGLMNELTRTRDTRDRDWDRDESLSRCHLTWPCTSALDDSLPALLMACLTILIAIHSLHERLTESLQEILEMRVPILDSLNNTKCELDPLILTSKRARLPFR